MNLLFVSDLHLSEKNPGHIHAFLKFLNESQDACSQLFILGDLFEIWIGDDEDMPLLLEVKEALKSFVENGTETFFIHGNRDFLIGKIFSKETGIKILSDPYTFWMNGKKIILSHGDFLCTDDKDYIKLRKKVRKKDWQSDFLSRPLDERRKIAAGLREDSKKSSAQKAEHITDVNHQTLKEFINKNKPDFFIHGHTHRPMIHSLDSCKRVVLGDWDKYGWAFLIDDQKHELKKFSINSK